MEVPAEISPAPAKGVILTQTNTMGTNRNNGSLYSNIHNGVATVEFGHPAGNSFVSELLIRLETELKNLSADEEVNIIVLRSEGEGAFCAGASLDELLAISDAEEAKVFFAGFAGVINAMRNCSKPIIGRVQGKAVGGGVGLLAACDYVFATETASIRLSELSIGIAPLVIAAAVERKTGKAGLAELSLSPEEWKTAYWAKEKGLYTRVFEKLTELDKELDLFVQRLGSYSPEAMRALRVVLWEGTEHWDSLLSERAAMSGRLALTANARQALEKFQKKG
jgi:methylglutaconyl-CoA hydratase